MLARSAALCVALMCGAYAVDAQDSPRQQTPPGGQGAPPAGGAPNEPPRTQDPLPPRPEARTVDRWGAVAYTADGAFGAAYGIESREDAERLAIDECRRESTDKADCERGVLVGQDSWFHIQFCRRGGEWSTHVIKRRTLSETTQEAARFAQTSKYGAEGCRMVPNGLFHSGGMHTKM
jgi:hypothetical protein